VAGDVSIADKKVAGASAHIGVSVRFRVILPRNQAAVCADSCSDAKEKVSTGQGASVIMRYVM